MALDDDRQAIFLVLNHRLADTFLKSLVDQASFLYEDSVRVFLCDCFHGVAWRLASAQTTSS